MPRLAELRPEVDRHLERIVERCLEKKPEAPASQLKSAVLVFNAGSADRTVIDEHARRELETIQEKAFSYIEGTYSDRQPLPTGSAIEAQTGELAELIARFSALCLGNDRREIAGAAAHSVTARVLTAPAMDAENTFAAPDAVKPAALEGVRVERGEVSMTLPAKAVAVLEVR